MLKMIPKCVTDENLKNLEWKDYLGDRVIAFHPSGFHVIVPKDCDPAVPLFCPVCQCALSTGEDVSTCRDFGCCDHCKDRWYYPNKEQWSTGWRPVQESRCEHKKTVIVDVAQ